MVIKGFRKLTLPSKKKIEKRSLTFLYKLAQEVNLDTNNGGISLV